MTTQNPQDYTALQKQLFGNSEQLKNTSNMESNTAGAEIDKEATSNIFDLRESSKQGLKPILQQELLNATTNETATLTLKGLQKMISDRAVQKSVANGFKPEQHFKAVMDIKKLWNHAEKAHSHTDKTDKNLTIHRYNAPFENANAKLTLKEYVDNGKKIYSLELESLEAVKFHPSGKDLTEQFPKSKDTDTTSFVAPLENANEIIPQLPKEADPKYEYFNKNWHEATYKAVQKSKQDPQFKQLKEVYKDIKPLGSIDYRNGIANEIYVFDKKRGFTKTDILNYKIGDEPFIISRYGDTAIIIDKNTARVLGDAYVDGKKARFNDLIENWGEQGKYNGKAFTIGKNKSLQEAQKEANKKIDLLAVNTINDKINVKPITTKPQTTTLKDGTKFNLVNKDTDPISGAFATSENLAKIGKAEYLELVLSFSPHIQQEQVKALKMGLNDKFMTKDQLEIKEVFLALQERKDFKELSERLEQITQKYKKLQEPHSITINQYYTKITEREQKSAKWQDALKNANSEYSRLTRESTLEKNKIIQDFLHTQAPISKKQTESNLQDIPFTDSKGKEQILSKEIQEQWLKTFNLKSLEDTYTPQLPQEVKEALGGKEIRLQLGSLKKLVSQGREQFIPQIKAVLDEPEAILKDSDNAFLFAKHLKDDDYFVNVSVDKGEYLVSISNGIKETNNNYGKIF